jgi:gluconolactonase
MRDTSVTGTLLRRPGPPRPLSEAKTAVIDDPRLSDVLDPDAPLLCLYEHATFSEGVIWDAPRERLVWSDVDGRRVLGWYPDGHVEVVIDATDFINGNAVDRDGRLLHCEHGRRCISRSNEPGEATPFLTHFEGKRFNSPNDITLAPDGTVWFSDPTFGLKMPNQGSLREPELDHRSVYRHDPDTGETRRMADFEQPNGLAFSADGRTLYVSDTARALDGDTHDIIAFDVAVDGSLSGRRLFQSVEPGIPDGFVVDERGWVWTTSKAGMQIFAADGAKLGLIPTPNVCANCDFGGPDGRRLFIAAKTMLLAVDLR